MVKVALVRPDFRGLTHPPDTPSGLLYIAAYLEKHGYYPDVFDLNKQEMPDLLQYDVIGFSMLPLARKQVYELIDELKSKKPEIRIILGGVFPSACPELLTNNLNIDAVVIGEGEETFRELIQFWHNQGNSEPIPKSMQGLCTKEHGMHEKRQLLDINKLPIPAYHHTNPDWYTMTFAQNNKEFKANGLTLSKERVQFVCSARGCPNYPPCGFCDTPRFWQYKYRFRSAEHIFKEIKFLYDKYNVKVFSFNDDAFPVNKKQCIDFCKLIVKNNLQIAWKSDTRADVLDEEMIEWMKKSGCFMVALGIESGSEKIRKIIHKHLNIERAKETIRLLKKHGILAYALIMLGNYGETRETVLETRKFLEEAQPDIATWVTGVLLCYGTEVYDIAKKQGYVTDDYWLKKTDGMPTYYGGHSKETIQEWAGLLNGWKK